MRILFKIGLALLVCQWALANDKDNGGVGVSRDGGVLTIGSAQIKLEDQPIIDPPGLREMLIGINYRLNLPEDYRRRIHLAAYPLGERKYFRIDEDDVLPERIEAIVQAYREALPPLRDEKVEVFAITSGKETYLLPRFFELRRNEQAAILFHESLWVMAPRNLSIPDVVKAEVGFQKICDENLLDGFNADVFRALEKVFTDRTLAMKAAYESDRFRGETYEVTLGDLMPSSTIRRLTESIKKRGFAATEDLLFHVGEKVRQYPQRQYYREFYRALEANQKIAVDFFATGSISMYWVHVYADDHKTWLVPIRSWKSFGFFPDYLAHLMESYGEKEFQVAEFNLSSIEEKGKVTAEVEPKFPYYVRAYRGHNSSGFSAKEKLVYRIERFRVEMSLF